MSLKASLAWASSFLLSPPSSPGLLCFSTLPLRFSFSFRDSLTTKFSPYPTLRSHTGLETDVFSQVYCPPYPPPQSRHPAALSLIFLLPPSCFCFLAFLRRVGYFPFAAFFVPRSYHVPFQARWDIVAMISHSSAF